MSKYLNLIPKILIGVLIFLGLFLRFYLLGKIPLALYHDEMDHVFAGEAIARFGSDITGQWSFWRLIPLQTLNTTAELASFFHAWGQKILGFGPQFSHHTNAIFALATCVLLYFFTKSFSQNKLLAFWSSLFLLINPWHIYISRMNYEVVISLFFQLLTIFSLYQIFYAQKFTKNNFKSKLFYFSLLSCAYFFAFFTYHGAKIFLPTITLTLICGANFIYRNYKNKSFYFFFGLTLMLITLNFIPVWHNHQRQLLGDRENSDLIFSPLNQQQLIQDYRRENLTFPLQKVFINQPTTLLQEIIKRYFYAWDIFRLYTGRESGYQFSLNVHSFFYLSSFFFFICGFALLKKLSLPQKLFYYILLIISPITTALSGSNLNNWQSIFRSAFFYLILIQTASFGFYYFFTQMKQKQTLSKKLLSNLVLIIIILEVINFAYHYFSRYPIITADNHYFAHRLLASYLGHKNKKDQIYVIIDDLPYSYARAYIFYQQLMPILSLEEKAQFQHPNTETIKVNNVIFTRQCLDLEDKDHVILSLHKHSSCKYDYQKLKKQDIPPKTTINTISSPRDSGAYFYLLKGDLCHNINAGSFIHQININNYQAEKLSLAEFCQNWVKYEPF